MNIEGLKEIVLIKTEVSPVDLVVKKGEKILNSNEDDSEFLDIKFSLVKVDENENVIDKIGSISGVVIDRCYMVDRGLDPLIEFDNACMENLFDILYKEVSPVEKDDEEYEYCFKNEALYPNIFYIENLYINSNYVNQDWDKYLLENLADILFYHVKQQVGLIIANPLEFECNADKILEDKKEIFDFCKKCGYKKTPREDCVYMEIM